MKYLIFFIMSISQVQAADWFCSEESSERNGNTISACGIASHPDEATARNMAFHNARIEFENICKSSADCVAHYITMKPKRTDCHLHDGVYKCSRLNEYYIGGVIVSQQMVIPHYHTMNDNIDAEVRRLKKEQDESFEKSYRYAEGK